MERKEIIDGLAKKYFLFIRDIISVLGLSLSLNVEVLSFRDLVPYLIKDAKTQALLTLF